MNRNFNFSLLLINLSVSLFYPNPFSKPCEVWRALSKLGPTLLLMIWPPHIPPCSEPLFFRPPPMPLRSEPSSKAVVIALAAEDGGFKLKIRIDSKWSWEVLTFKKYFPLLFFLFFEKGPQFSPFALLGLFLSLSLSFSRFTYEIYIFAKVSRLPSAQFAPFLRPFALSSPEQFKVAVFSHFFRFFFFFFP